MSRSTFVTTPINSSGKIKTKKAKVEVPDVASAEDVIQAFHKAKAVTSQRGYNTVVTKEGSSRLIYTKGNASTVVSIRDKVTSGMGSRVMVRINLEFPDFTILQLVAGNCKSSDEIFSMSYQVINLQNLKSLWNEIYDRKQFMES